jgi:hypothetical protein
MVKVLEVLPFLFNCNVGFRGFYSRRLPLCAGRACEGALSPLTKNVFGGTPSPSLPSDLAIAIFRHRSTVTHRTQLRLMTIRRSHGNGVACEGADTGVGKQTLAQSEGADYHIAPLQRMA